MKTVTFHGFANGRGAFAEVMADVTADNIALIAKRVGGMASKEISASYDGDDRGTIYAGLRSVARFTVSDLPFYLLPRHGQE